MKYRPLGKSGARVSEICLGAMTFGEADEKSFMHKVGASEEVSHAMMSRALDAGVNFWDTANVYGQDGLSERVIGAWFAKNGHRDDVVLATKVPLRHGPRPQRARREPAAHQARGRGRRCERLGTDRIDLYQIHMQDAKTPEEEVVRALDELVREGKINYFGASNYAAYRLVESLWAADRAGTNGFVTLQAQYSLIERNLELEHIPALRRFGLGLLPYSPLGGGFLTGKYRAIRRRPRARAWRSKPIASTSARTSATGPSSSALVAAAKEHRRDAVAGRARVAAAATDGDLGDPGRALGGSARGRTEGGRAGASQRARLPPRRRLVAEPHLRPTIFCATWTARW